MYFAQQISIRMISEGSCDTEDRMAAENSALTGVNKTTF